MDFLTESGRKIYKRLETHCKDKMKMMDIDSLELSMLAHSFDLYFETAKFCSDNGVKMTFVTEKGTYEQIRPEYTVMKNEYQNILKHGAKFGLNPGDREKVFKGLQPKEKKKGFTLN
jgi:P27 family predicted phage terminase small subunit